MNKAKVMTATATLVAGLGVASHVNADEVDFSTATQNPEAQTNQTENNVTKADVNAAKADFDTANQAVSHQEQVVSDAATVADEAQSAYDQAQQSISDAQNLVDQATPENIASAQDDINSAQEQVSQADTAEKVGENTVAQAQEAVNNQQASVDEAQSAVDTAQSDVDAAQKDVNEKQAILDGTGEAEIITNRDKAQADVNSAQNQVAQAESDLTKAQTADAKRQQAIDNAQTAVDEANQTVTSSKSDLAAKTAKANQTEQALKNAEAAYKVAENDYKAINTITLSQAYVDAFKKYADYSLSSEERKQAAYALSVASAALNKENMYKPDANDNTITTYQINDLPDNVIQELSLFGADLLNQVRKIFNASEAVVTSSSIKFADLVTDGYVRDNWSVGNEIALGHIGHDAKAVNEAARYFGLSTSSPENEKKGGQFYEDWTSSSVYDGMTIGQLKQKVYEAVVDFLFNAGEWRHALDIIGSEKASGKTYFAVDFSYPKSGVGVYAGAHFINVPDYQVGENSNFNTTAFVNTKSAEKVTAAYNTAQSALANAQSDNNVAQEAKTAAQLAYNNAISQLSSASASLTQAQSVAIQTPTAQANLASAETDLTKAQERLTKANKAVDDLSADIAVKQANLASAKQVLSTKQATLATKQATLTNEQNRLASLQNSLATAQANVLKAKENVITAKENLTKVQTYLTRLQNAPELLAQAQQQEATAKANLLAALDTLEAELLKLKDLQVKQAAAQAVYDTTSKAYQTILDAQEKQRLQDEYNAIVAQGKTPVPIVDETGKIVSYQAEDPQTTIQSSSVESTAVKAQVKPVEEASVVTASALPVTGEHSSVLAVLFGCLMTIWGLVGVRRKNN